MTKKEEIGVYVDYMYGTNRWFTTSEVYHHFVDERGFKPGTVSNILYKLRTTGDPKNGYRLMNQSTLNMGRAKIWQKVPL